MRHWYTMKAEDKTGEILIYGEIGASWWEDDTVSAKQFNDDLKALGDITTLNLRINSPGGDAFDGIAIHNTLKNHPAKVVATVDGIAASAASVVLMAADKIVMPANSFLLIHGASGFAMGNATDMRALAEDLERLDTSITATYATRSGQTEAKIASIMKEDRLMDAAEAIKLGLADEQSDAVKLAASYSMRLLPRKAADRLKAIMSSEAAPPQPKEGEDAGDEKSPASTPPAVEEPKQDPPKEDPPKDDPQPSNVVELRAKAKTEGADEHARYVNEVLDLCNMASLPAMARNFIAEKKPVADVRNALMSERARLEAQAPVIPHRPAPLGTPAPRKWDSIVEKINARMRKK
ncbi:head maturation protease, ClpP-related [Bradyrhizobium sp. BRP23]|uniref:head maturation protease, ClpP-related n=1 Tax=Bradyrhizobium sp. BRP23 TaxID=2793820 RepID=UPI001CD6FBA1|nr:head maturation protease, ClpP-related [Bradyrhizobium sp. BRP23]MCA1419484.1 ATP-dependent Clp protease proteolytic subunit [Bradyrhizobium sp. BRP23]